MAKSESALALTPEQVRMVEENHNLIYGFLHKNNLCEDMYSVVGIGLCRAVASFNAGKGTTFSTYAYTCMLNECRKVWRKEKKQRMLNPISMEEAISDTENLRIEDFMRSKDAIETAETTEFFAWFIENASTKDLLIILRMIQGCTQVEIAEEMGCTRSYVGARVKSIREKYSSGKKLHCKGNPDAGQEQRLKQEILKTIRHGWEQ